MISGFFSSGLDKSGIGKPEFAIPGELHRPLSNCCWLHLGSLERIGNALDSSSLPKFLPHVQFVLLFSWLARLSTFSSKLNFIL